MAQEARKWWQILLDVLTLFLLPLLRKWKKKNKPVE